MLVDVTGPQSSAPEEAAAFFATSPLGLTALTRVQSTIDALGRSELRVTDTQIGWARRRGFAFLWQPRRWLRPPAAEVVLSIASTRPIPSPRWKQVVEVRPGLFMHHLELRADSDLDDETDAWLAEAFEAAGPDR